MFHEEALFSKTWNRRTSRWAFLRALVVAFEELTTLGMNPSKTEWATHHAYFNKNARPRMLAEWSKITDLDPSLFPWQDDEVGTTWEEWRKTATEKEASTTWDHIARSPNCSASTSS